MQKRLIVAGLKLVGADQEPVRLLLESVGNVLGWEAVQGRFADRFSAVLVLTRECHNGSIWTFRLDKLVDVRMEICERPLDAGGHDHRPSLTADLLQRDN